MFLSSPSNQWHFFQVYLICLLINHRSLFSRANTAIQHTCSDWIELMQPIVTAVTVVFFVGLNLGLRWHFQGLFWRWELFLLWGWFLVHLCPGWAMVPRLLTEGDLVGSWRGPDFLRTRRTYEALVEGSLPLWGTALTWQARKVKQLLWGITSIKGRLWV